MAMIFRCRHYAIYADAASPLLTDIVRFIHTDADIELPRYITLRLYI